MRGSCLVAAPGHPLAEKAMVREGFRYPWVDITYTEHEPYILHPPGPDHGPDIRRAGIFRLTVGILSSR